MVNERGQAKVMRKRGEKRNTIVGRRKRQVKGAL
jgi:hypothetical protein